MIQHIIRVFKFCKGSDFNNNNIDPTVAFFKKSKSGVLFALYGSVKHITDNMMRCVNMHMKFFSIGACA